MDTSQTKTKERPICKYGTECYQKNPFHRMQYRHPTAKRDLPDRNSESDHPAKKRATNEAVQKKPEPTEQTGSCDDPSTPKKLKVSKDANMKPLVPLSDSAEIADQKVTIKSIFLMDMPHDFYDFWQFCRTLNRDRPYAALRDCGLQLVGPFEVLSGRITTPDDSKNYPLHWRYFYDPPEFQTVIVGDQKMGFHIGYFRDDPSEKPVFLVSNASEVDSSMTKMGDNLFAAVYLHLTNIQDKADPLKKMKITKMLYAIKDDAGKLDYSLLPVTPAMKRRNTVCLTFNKLGLAVPYNKKYSYTDAAILFSMSVCCRTQVGYRSLTMSDKKLRSVLNQMLKATPEGQANLRDALQDVFTYASIAIDECDFGTGIELGWNLLSSGVDCLNKTIESFLVNSYNLLHRDAFSAIITSHMRNRKKGTALSVL